MLARLAVPRRWLLGGVLLGLLVAPAAAQDVADLDGFSRDLDQLRGQVVLLNFWATWCLPCRVEMPIFSRLQRKHGEAGLRVIALSTDEPSDRRKVESAIRKLKMDFPVWVGGTTEHMRNVGLGDVLPGTVLIDREGAIVARYEGLVDEAVLEQALVPLLAREASPGALAQAAAVAPEAHRGHGCDLDPLVTASRTSEAGSSIGRRGRTKRDASLVPS
ncbi:MAG: TlpA disulfide reductase family protein [Acidobacteriota bacterium]